jgi:hypothetical protein
MRILILVAIAAIASLFVPAGASPPPVHGNSEQHENAKPANAELGTKSAPAAIEITNVPRVEISSVPMLRVESTDRTPPKPVSYWTPEWVLALATAILATITGALARYTYKLYRATVNLSSDAKLSAEQQTQRMERSIKEAARAATAMEGVATATTENTALMPTLLRKQMRAYLSVDIGGATYQDANLRFAAAPVITNNGLTPARNVRNVAVAGIIDGRDPATTQFTPIGVLPESDMGVAPRQSFITNAIVPDRVPDAEVAAIMEGLTRRLFCWGKITYDDVYGGSWETNFCLNYTFYPGEDQKVKVKGWFYPRHNGAT